MMARWPLISALLALMPAAAAAQGRFTMPLPAGELPAGTLTVKVVGTGLSDIVVGKDVVLQRRDEGGFTESRRATTGVDGRATFDRLAPSDTYRVLVSHEGAELVSSEMTGPAAGGLRLLLSLSAEVDPMQTPAPQPGAPPGPAPGGALPPGHPPVPESAAESGGGAAEVVSAPELAPGQVEVVVLRGTKREPLGKARVLLVTRVDVSMVGGKPVSRPVESRPFETAGSGKVVVTVPAGSGERPMLMVEHDGLTYRSQPLSLPEQGGLRATFQVYDRVSSSRDVSLGEGTQILAQVGEGTVTLLLVMVLENTGNAIFDPGKEGLLLPVPEGARGAEAAPQHQDLLRSEREKTEVRFISPLPPGTLEVRYYVELPASGAEVDLRVPFGLATRETFLAMLDGIPRASGPSVDSMEERELTVQGEVRKRPVYRLKPVARGEVLKATITGLPHRDRRPVAVVVGLSLLVVLWGLVAAVRGAGWSASRRSRVDGWLDELARLERARMEPAQKAARREELMGRLRAEWPSERRDP